MNELETKQERYNTLVSNIINNKGKVTTSFYEIGLDLKEIKERELYLLEFRNFEEFLEKRVVIERSTAYLAIEMANTYSIREFSKWGLKKLLLIKRRLPEEEDRKDFMKSHSVEPVRQVEDNIETFKLDKGIKEIKQFEGQIGKSRTKEKELTLIRQWSSIDSHFRAYLELIKALKSEISTWMHQSKEYTSNIQLNECTQEAQDRLKRLE